MLARPYMHARSVMSSLLKLAGNSIMQCTTMQVIQWLEKWSSRTQSCCVAELKHSQQKRSAKQAKHTAGWEVCSISAQKHVLLLSTLLKSDFPSGVLQDSAVQMHHSIPRGLPIVISGRCATTVRAQHHCLTIKHVQ